MTPPSSAPSIAALLLRLRIAAMRANPFVAAAVLLVLLVAGSLWGTLHATWQLEREDELLAAQTAREARAARGQGQAAASAPAPAAPQVDNLERFYATLGSRRDAEQEVKTLFELAGKNGLLLRQGEYKTTYDRNARVHTYQVNLPVKGSYGAIWQFALGALQTMPFASLDDISFHRDAIGDPAVEARLRLTLYLRDGAVSGMSGGSE